VEAREAEEARKVREVREAELTLPAEPPADSTVPLANIRWDTLGQIRFYLSDKYDFISRTNTIFSRHT
jgi:hypothetical protein